MSPGVFPAAAQSVLFAALLYARHGYNNPVKYIDPSGHWACTSGDQYDPGCLETDNEKGDYWRMMIKFQYGITLSNDGEKAWNLTNIMLVYESLGDIDAVLGGQTKELVSGTVFVMDEYIDTEGSYAGEVDPDTLEVTFETKGNAAIRQMNIYHEFGHVLDNLPGKVDVFSNALTNASDRSFIGGNNIYSSDAIASDALRTDYVATDPNYDYVQAIQASKTGDVESWADAFANYVAGNINLNRSQGQALDDFVSGALAQQFGFP